MRKIILSILFLFTAASATRAQSKWAIDNAHSKVEFSVSHMVISDVTGQFKTYDGKLIAKNDDFTDSQIELTIDVASISTDNEKRDTHLKDPVFFDAATYPKITFKSKSFKKVDGNKYKLIGDLTIKGITKQVELDVKYNGTVKDPWGNTKAGFKLTGEINRFDYGLKWNTLLETGGAVVGETVTITSNIELTKQP
ncbi:MAG: YceI family protein [Chlorobiales bacterium]|nr:YceI family protein [Chlorobiales bacterium]